MKGFENFKPHHLPLEADHVHGNKGVGRVFLLPGSDGRALRIGERLKDRQVLPSDRRHNVYLGRFESESGSADIGTVATGMGCPSLDIIVSELIAMGARRFIRVGTSGSLQPKRVKAGHLVIATAAVRDEGASDRYVTRDYPAVAHADVAAALEEAAYRLGHGARVFKGVIHSKDSLFAREMGYGPRDDQNERYMAELRRMGVLASEMEAAHLFILSDVYSAEVICGTGETDPLRVVKSGAVLAIIGDESAFASPDLARGTETLAIDTALEGAIELVNQDLKART